MKNLRAAAIAGAAIAGLFLSSSAFSADVSSYLPAVSGINGKIEFQGGPYTSDTFGGGMEWRGGATLSIPLEDRFGIQADIAAANTLNAGTAEGGALHLFTRDPNSYLLGLTGAAYWTGIGNGQLIGPEVELYSGPVTFHAFAGYMNSSIAGVNTGTFFGIGNISYYANPNLALTVGAKDINNFKTAHAGLEWQFSDTAPVAFTLDGKIGDDNYRAVDAGIRIYFGAGGKSLQRRHREDDPSNAAADVFNGAGSAFGDTGNTPTNCIPQTNVGPNAGPPPSKCIPL